MTRRIAPALAVAALLLAGVPAPAGAEYRVAYTFGAGQFGALGPGGVAEDADGNVYVTDPTSNQVEKFSSTGDSVGSWGSSRLSGPRGIAVNRLGRVYVADTSHDRIQRFGPQGSPIDPPLGSGLSGPSGVAVDDVGDVFIADTGNDRVVKLDPSGSVVPFDGGARTGADRIAIDRAGDVYVSDAAGVQELSPTGALIRTLHPAGGVAIDDLGNAYVAVPSDGIRKFNPSGAPVVTPELNVRGIHDVALDADGGVIAATSTDLTRFAAVAPVTTITSAPSGLIENASADFAFRASIAGSTFECRIAGSGADFAPCASPFTAVGLAPGLNRFEARAIDPEGIRERSPATVEFSVDGAQGPPGFDGFDGLPGFDGERGPRGRRGKAGGLIVKGKVLEGLRSGTTVRLGLKPSIALRGVRVELRLGSSHGTVVAAGARKRLPAGRITVVRLQVVHATTARDLALVVHGRTARGRAVLLAKRLG